jgi:arsenite methyltransferase
MDSAYRADVDFDRFSIAGTPRLFTEREANALLPLLEPLVARMREAARPRPEATEIVQAFGRRLDVSGGGRPDASEADAQRELAESAEALHETLEELDGLGVQVKDPVRGLLDFPSERAGEIVELCWLHGEPAVSHWHRIGEGFAGRRPIAEEAQ